MELSSANKELPVLAPPFETMGIVFLLQQDKVPVILYVNRFVGSQQFLPVHLY